MHPIRGHSNPTYLTRVASQSTQLTPVSKSQTLSVLSMEAETAHLPSRVTARAATDLEWPTRIRDGHMAT